MNEMVQDWQKKLELIVDSHGGGINGKPIAYHKGRTELGIRQKWFQLPLRARLTFLMNALSFAEDPDTKPAFGVIPDKRLAHAKTTPYLHLLSTLTSDVSVLEWLVKGDSALPTASFREVVEKRLHTDAQPIQPCRATYRGKQVGILMTVEQFLGFASLFMGASYLGLLDLEKEQLWLWDERAHPVGITANGEPVGQVVSAMMREMELVQKRLLPELGAYPLLLGIGSPPELTQLPHYMHGEEATELLMGAVNRNNDTSIRLIHLHPQFLREQMPGLRRIISPDAVKRIKWDDPDLAKGVLGWFKPLFMPSQPAADEQPLVRCLNLCEETMNRLLGKGIVPPTTVKELPVRDDSEEEPSASPALNQQDEPTNSAHRRKAKKLERSQKFDTLPNVLEGLDAFTALHLTANDGFFEKSFVGRPMVVDRLRHEAAEKADEEADGESCRQSRGVNGNGFGASLVDVVKGNLVFAQQRVFSLVRDRRYNARAMLKLMKRPVDRNLPDIQVLAPHEFGQVPGFVAGQYRPQRDRLCTVMITYDPDLWELSLRDRKTLIDSSRAPKLWVFPRQWLFDLSSGYHWWDAAYFGTPKDPAILDFVIPNGDYTI